MNLTGNPQRDMAMYVMNPDEYSKAIVTNAAKGLVGCKFQFVKFGIRESSDLHL